MDASTHASASGAGREGASAGPSAGASADPSAGRAGTGASPGATSGIGRGVDRPAGLAAASGAARSARGAFADRVVVLTGAAGGIGQALARRFVAEGARVALLDLDASGVAALAADLEASGHAALAVPCDITSEDACREAIERVEAAWGGVDVLVHNAGITHLGAVRETDARVLRRVMEVNYFGAVHLTAHALPSLLARRGLVIAISSVAGFAPLYGRAGYAASKHALHGFFDTLRSEVARDGVRVLVVCPSFTDTGIEQRALGADGGRPRFVRRTTGRLASPDEVAAAIVRAAARGQRLLVLSPVGKIAWWLSRLAPRMYERLMLRTQAPLGR